MQSEMNRRMRGERKENRLSLSLSVLVIVVIKVHGEEKGRDSSLGDTRIRPQGREGRSVGVGGWVSE